MGFLEKIGIDVIGGAVIILLGWLGWKKAQKVATSEGAETDVVALLNGEVKRLSAQVSDLSISHANLSLQMLKEREDCSRDITTLGIKVEQLEARISADSLSRQHESDLRKRGLIKTRSTDK